MATRYVRSSGLDTNNGTTPALAWKTLGKALGASGLASGDVCYVGAGVYREVVTVAMTNATVETKVIADWDGSQTGDAGEVVWTAYTTNDKTIPSANAPLSTAGKPFLTFVGFTFQAGSSTGINMTSPSANTTFTDCTFLPGTTNISYMSITAAVDTALNLTIDRCIFGRQSTHISFTVPTSTVADYNLNVVVRNCIFHASTALDFSSSGANTFHGGGGTVTNCSFLWHANPAIIARTGMSTTIPLTVNGCLFHSPGSVGVNAFASGMIVEDWNLLVGSSRTNVSIGTHSISDGSYATLYELGQAEKRGAAPRPFASPMAGSSLLGFGAAASPPTVDLLNRIRPAGGTALLNAVGAYERHDTGARETTTVRTGSNALRITGPGDQSFDVPVNATATTLTVWTRFDTNYGTTTRPAMTVTNGGEAGVADATATAVGAINTWEQLTLTFTPTSAGIVTVRLISRPAAATGISFWDDFAVA